MLLAFFVDQILQGFDKKFQACYAKIMVWTGGLPEHEPLENVAEELLCSL
jgi:hypothetical protein